MKLTLLGTGNAAMLPVYGCTCIACQRAMDHPQYQRQKTSALIEQQGKKLLLDANCNDLLQRFPSGSIDRILLTHYHMDHVHALFDLRWGVGAKIPIDGPADANGCDDLFKHPGILDFQPPLKAFQSFIWQGIKITPLPMLHSKICFGYSFIFQGQCIVYLTDTVGLPAATQAWLKQHCIDIMLLDCSHSPEHHQVNKNHNDFDDVEAIIKAINPKKMHLIHISHELECWAMRHPERFNTNLTLSVDGEIFQY